MSDKIEERMKSFKKTVDQDDGRRRREDVQITIRKAKKEDRLAKRRMAAPADPPPTELSNTTAIARNYTLLDLPELVQILQDNSASAESRIEATRAVRRMLSATDAPPVREIINAGALTPLTESLMRVDCHELQLEAAWALTNIASTSFTSVVAEQPNAVKYLIDLLRSPQADVREQCAWCLGNIAGDGAEFRDRVLRQGGLESLLLNIKEPANDSLLGNVTWTVSNLCRGKPLPSLELVADAIPALCFLATYSPVDAIKTDALWALSYVSDGDDPRLDAILRSDTSIATTLVGIMAEGKPALVAPALRTLGNFVSGNEGHTQAVIDADVLGHAMGVLNCPKRNLRKEMCWLLSNIAAGTQSQIAALMKAPHVADALVSKAIESDWETKKEAIYAVANICTGGSDTQVQLLVNLNGIAAMSDVLQIPSENRMVLVALDAIENILTVSERNGFNYPVVLDEANGIERIEELQSHDDNEIYEKSVHIIERFFSEQEAEDENLAPRYDGNAFAFGMSPPPAKNLFDGPVTSSPSPSFYSFGGNTNFNH